MAYMNDYYRNQLNEQGKRYYDLIVKQIGSLALNGQVEIRPAFTKKDLKTALDAFFALRSDRPELYFMDNTVRGQLSFPGKVTLLQENRFSKSHILRVNKLLRRRVREIIGDTEGLSLIEKEKRIYRSIARSYDYENGKYSYDLSGLIVYKKGVCDALSSLLVVSLREAHIPAIKVHGIADGQPHSWVKAWLNQTPYYLDVTWDMKRGGLFDPFLYFNLPEEVFMMDHQITEKPKACIFHML